MQPPQGAGGTGMRMIELNKFRPVANFFKFAFTKRPGEQSPIILERFQINDIGPRQAGIMKAHILQV